MKQSSPFQNRLAGLPLTVTRKSETPLIIRIRAGIWRLLFSLLPQHGRK